MMCFFSHPFVLTLSTHDEAEHGAPGSVVEHVSLPNESLRQPVGRVEHHHAPPPELHAVEGPVHLSQSAGEKSEGSGVIELLVTLFCWRGCCYC